MQAHDKLQDLLLPPSSLPLPAAGVGRELEDILNDASLPPFRRIWFATWIELHLLVRLVPPAMVICLIDFVMMITMLLLTGDLVSPFRGSLGVELPLYHLLLGMGCALETLCGQAYGAGRYEKLGVYLQRSIVLFSAAAGLLAVLYAITEPFSIVSMAEYNAYPHSFPMQKFLQAQSIMTPNAYIHGVTAVVHILLTWVGVYVIGWGALGTSLILFVSHCIIIVAQFVYVVTSERCRKMWMGFSTEAFSGLREFLRLSVASALMLCLDIWYNRMLALLASFLEHPELALDSLAICSLVSACVWTIYFGFIVAASVRVSNELGAGHPKAAARSVVVVTLALRDFMSYAFTEREAVAAAVSDLWSLEALTIVLIGMAPLRYGVVVGCGWQAFVAYVNVGCYLFFGIPLGWLLGFYFQFGVKGIWVGLMGGTFMQTLILIYVMWTTDWNKEVRMTRKRLDK